MEEYCFVFIVIRFWSVELEINGILLWRLLIYWIIVFMFGKGMIVVVGVKEEVDGNVNLFVL